MRVTAFAVSLLGWGMFLCAPAQTAEQAASGEEVVRVLVPAPRDLRDRLARLKTALSERQFLTAAEQLYELRSSLETDDYFLVEPHALHARGLRRELRRVGGNVERRGPRGVYGAVRPRGVGASGGSHRDARLR